MKSYSDMPMLVIAKILAFAFNGADGDLIKWKSALSLLSVCHNWRVYGKHLLYRYAIIVAADPGLPMRDTYQDELDWTDVESVTDSESSEFRSVSPVGNVVPLDSEDSICVYTNIKLIEVLGLGRMVKQLIFDRNCCQNRINKVDPLKSFIPLLQALVNGWSEEIMLIKPFTAQYELECLNTDPGNLVENQCHIALKEAADTVVYKYPNVNSINAAVYGLHEYFQKLILDLAVGYDKQLTKFACLFQTAFPFTLSAQNLIELELILSDSLYQNLPTICPGSLQKINILLENIELYWDMFRVDKESKAIVFDNLQVLSITGMDQYSDIDFEILANDLELEFPKLEQLFLINSRLTRKEVHAMICHSLKQLRFEGSIIAASELCEQPLGNLDRLDLVWRQDMNLNEADSFVTIANDIFNKLDGIEHVRFDIRFIYCTLNMDDIYWPHLTHLSLSVMIPFSELLVMIPKMPNLVRLDMVITGYLYNKFPETTELLTNIRMHYPEPSSSKIKTLHLVDKRIILRRESYCELPFVGAIENLKWYWPQLTDIDIQCEVNEL